MTIPFARLLLATEHTEFDVGAERVAFALAREGGVPLACVLPLVTNVEYEAVAPDVVARAEQETHARSVALRAAAARARVDVDVRVRRGEEPWREIVAEAEVSGADLLISRRRGKRSFLAKLMVGEMVGKVATAARCDVLLVPRAATKWTRRVLGAVDASRAAADVARTAGRVAAEAGLPLTIATVAAHDSQAERAAAQAVVAAAATVARGEGAAVDERVAAGHAADTIAALASEIGADLVVCGRGGPKVHGRLHLGSNAQRIAGLVSCAVLVVSN